MAKPGQSYPFTADLREEFEAETQTLLRRRFVWFSGVLSGLGALLFLLGIGVGILALQPSAESIAPSVGVATPTAKIIIGWVIGGLALLCYVGCFIAARRGAFGREGMLRLTYALVLTDGMLQVIGAWTEVPGAMGLFGVLITHVLACSFLPWTPAQAIRPLLPILALDAILTLTLSDNDIVGRLIAISLSAIVGVPGTMLCWMRHSRRLENYKLKFFQRRYGEVRRELVDARRIHEALFPPPLAEGPIHFTYLYEPMRQIGGDYLYACTPYSKDLSGLSPSNRLSVVLMDVTGHGIPAALTVNRLHGELQRIFAEQPDVDPGEVLRLLNRYVNLTLANHSVYVTALCMRIDALADTLEFASGGHPPAYIYAVDGTIHELISTAFVLGACADPDFLPEPISVHFGGGDTLIAYTDGALEARSHNGRMIGLSGMRRLVASVKGRPEKGWPAHILSAVEQHRDGPPEDDTLVIEITRPIQSGVPATKAVQPAAAQVGARA